MTIALLGLFGCGNSGNDGSLEAMINYLQKALPAVQLICICPAPATISERYTVPSISVGGLELRGRMARIDRAFAGVPRTALSLAQIFIKLRGVKVLVIPGTGILDDFQETASGWPFILFRWCIAAKLLRIPIAFVSVGAGPIKHPLSRWLFKSAVKCASYRSYRDEYSFRYLHSIGVNVSEDQCYPDLAFHLPVPPYAPISNRTTVVLGVMYYQGWKKSDPSGPSIYQRYLGKLALYVTWLVHEGYNVRLITGDALDATAIHDLLDRLVPYTRDRIETNHTESLHSVMEAMVEAEIVVASRYHNVVCSLMMGLPTISLSYNAKNDDLLERYGQHDYRQDIEFFDVDTLKEQTLAAMKNSPSIRSKIIDTNNRVKYRTKQQESELSSKLIADGF
jgi:polysaccharide pyruvyl transferase WcaK-like protein